MRSHTLCLTVQCVPPVHNVALLVLMLAAIKKLSFCRCGVEQHDIDGVLKLVTKAGCAAALIY